jgi:hypothetical protein
VNQQLQVGAKKTPRKLKKQSLLQLPQQPMQLQRLLQQLMQHLLQLQRLLQQQHLRLLQQQHPLLLQQRRLRLLQQQLKLLSKFFFLARFYRALVELKKWWGIPRHFFCL